MRIKQDNPQHSAWNVVSCMTVVPTAPQGRQRARSSWYASQAAPGVDGAGDSRQSFPSINPRNSVSPREGDTDPHGPRGGWAAAAASIYPRCKALKKSTLCVCRDMKTADNSTACSTLQMKRRDPGPEEIPRTQSRSSKALTFPSGSVSVDEEKVAQKR